MKTTTQNIGLYGIGTEFCIHLDNIGNDSDENIHNVAINVKVPSGVAYSKSNLQQGSYDPVRSTWDVGTLIKKSDIVGTMCFTVTDDTKGPFTFTFDIGTTGGCKGCDDDAMFCVTAEGVSCKDAAKCVGSSFYTTTETATGSTDVNKNMIYVRTWEFKNAFTFPQVLTGLIPDDIIRIVRLETSWTEPRTAGGGGAGGGATVGKWKNGLCELVEDVSGTDQPFKVDSVPTAAAGSDLEVTVYYTKL